MSALSLGIIAAFCWGLHDIAIRYLSRSVPLLGALFVVLIVGLLFQMGAFIIFDDPLIFQAKALWLSLASGVAFLMASLGLYYAFKRGPVRVVSPLIGAYPILSLIYEVAFGGHISALQILAVFFVIIGVGIVAVFSDTSKDEVPPLGPTILLSLISAIGFSTTFKLSQMAALLTGELQATLMARVVATVLLGLLILRHKEHLNIVKRAFVPLAIMGVLDGIALIAVISAAAKDSPQLAAVAASLFGLFTILLAWMFLKERMTYLQWFGCLLTFLAIGYLSL